MLAGNDDDYGTDFSFSEIGPDEVLKVLNSISSNAIGIDNVSIKMINLTLPHSLGAITSIINRSLKSGKFPYAWKTAIIKPIPKKINIETINDLRPIGILTALSKILEKVVNSRLLQFLESKNIIPLNQSGFRKKHSTPTALLHIVDEILNDGIQ